MKFRALHRRVRAGLGIFKRASLGFRPNLGLGIGYFLGTRLGFLPLFGLGYFPCSILRSDALLLFADLSFIVAFVPGRFFRVISIPCSFGTLRGTGLPGFGRLGRMLLFIDLK